MAGKKDKEFVMIVPRLTKGQAIKLRNSLTDTTKAMAPNSKSYIKIGRKKNMESIIKSCNRRLDVLD